MTREIWISANQACELLSKNSGRPIIPQYVRDLAQKGKIAWRRMDGRTNEYLRSDVEKIKVRPHGKNKVSAPDSVAEVRQMDLPVTEKLESAPSETLTSGNTLDSENRIWERFEDMEDGSMKRKAFVKQHGIHDSEFGNWLEFGLKGDRLPVTYYKYHDSKAAAFTPTQQEQVLEILKRHGKLKN
jgi:hypothetical protein